MSAKYRFPTMSSAAFAEVISKEVDAGVAGLMSHRVNLAGFPSKGAMDPHNLTEFFLDQAWVCAVRNGLALGRLWNGQACSAGAWGAGKGVAWTAVMEQYLAAAGWQATHRPAALPHLGLAMHALPPPEGHPGALFPPSLNIPLHPNKLCRL